MKFAYADPPYIGYSKYYKDDPRCAEVNHTVLLGYLCSHFDGWALSTHSNGLKQILTLPTFPNNARIGAWVKPFCSFKKNVQPAYAWEPVIFYTPKKADLKRETKRDWTSSNMTLEKGLIGAKPPRFAFWIFDLLLMDNNDYFEDVFPGTGIMMKAWKSYRSKYEIVQLDMLIQNE